MKLRCNDCNVTYEMPETYLEGGAGPFWDQHWVQYGHVPRSVSLICACGATQENGPAHHAEKITARNVMVMGAIAHAIDVKFYIEHQSHSEPRQ